MQQVNSACESTMTTTNQQNVAYHPKCKSFIAVPQVSDHPVPQLQQCCQAPRVGVALQHHHVLNDAWALPQVHEVW